MTKVPAKDDSFLKTLEKAVSDILAGEKSKPAERLKAIEAGAKLLMIRHRIEGPGEGGQSGSFFDS
jgi:hypothetical protein